MILEVWQWMTTGNWKIHLSFLAFLLGFLLDLLFGDPRWLYHPVRCIGQSISWLEKLFIGDKKEGIKKRDAKRERKMGIMLTIGIVLFWTLVPAFLLEMAGHIHPMVRLILESFWCYQLLATKSLKAESMKVYHTLKEGDLEQSRIAVSMIVGRDTKELDETGIIKATVETVAENTSDGVIAPLCYLFLFGASGGFFYKSINTLDSMVGYKNDRYLYFGRCSAKLDDVVNWIPARLSAFFMIFSSGLLGFSMKRAWQVFKRDRKNHASPNSAQTESVVAGALGIQLAGDAFYFGKRVEKETIGDETRSVEVEDIKRVNQLLYTTAVLGFLVFVMIKGLILLGLG